MKTSAVMLPILALSLCVTLLAQAQEERHPHPPTPGKQLPSYYLPTEFTLNVGGFFLPSYSVELRGESLLYRIRDIDPETHAVRETSKVITPSASQWRRFWKAMDEVGLWRWQSEYANPDVADGTQWGLEVAFGGRRAKSSGSNAYPSDVATSPDPSRPDASLPERSGVFEKYLSAVENLLGGKRFH